MKNQSKTSTSKLTNYFVRDSKVAFASTCFGLMAAVICSAVFSINVFAASYSIIYDDNVTSNMPTDESNATLNTSVNIPSNTPTRDGYVFKNWNTLASGTGTSYAPGASLIIDQTASNNNFNLYAIWQPSPYMQDVSTWASMIPNSGDTMQAVDKRDGKTYWVTRLGDGNIWMAQNLDHDINSGKTYTSADTDISADWTPSTSTYSTGDTTWIAYYTSEESYDPGDRCWNGVVVTESDGTLEDNTVDCANDNMHYHVGNYYNWTAALAMNDSGSYTTQNQDVNQSICPAGWRLPIGGTANIGTKSFQFLISQTGYASGIGGTIHQNPAYYVYGGYWGGASAGSVGHYGYYWSSVTESLYGGGLLFFDSGGTIDPRTSYSRNIGFSVRCVAR